MVEPAWSKSRGSAVHHEQMRRRLLISAVIVAFLLAITAAATWDGGLRPTLEPQTGSPVDLQVGCASRPGTETTVVIAVGDPTAPEATASLRTAIAAEQGVVRIDVDPRADQWNLGTSPEIAVRAVVDVIERASTTICIDAGGLVLAGFGRGAQVVGEVACREAGLIDAAIMVSGSHHPADCLSSQPVSITLVVAGDDQVLPIQGGWGPEAQVLRGDLVTPVAPEDALAEWGRDAECDGDSNEIVDPNGVARIELGGCPDGISVRASIAPAGGHRWTDAASAGLSRTLQSD